MSSMRFTAFLSGRFQLAVSLPQAIEFIGYRKRRQDGDAMGIDRARPLLYFLHFFINIGGKFAYMGGIVRSLEAVDLTVYFDLDGFHSYNYQNTANIIRARS